MNAATSKKPDVSVIIVSYNTRDMTLACLNSVFEQSSTTNIEVIVVDNASSDGSADAIQKLNQNVYLISSTENLGFAKANNLAARNANGKYILLLNPDTVILDNAIGRLLKFATENSKAGIWGGRTVFADGRLNPASSWGFMSLDSLFFQALGLSTIFKNNIFFNPEGYGGWKRNNVKHVDIVTGCFLLITKALWDKLNGLDETFYMYAEEADLCYRAKELGAQPLATPNATIIHYGGASEAARSGKMIKLLTGKATFIRKHWNAAASELGIFLLKAGALVRLLGFSTFGFFKRDEKYTKLASEWRDIWKARKIWSSGNNLSEFKELQQPREKR
jgi:N-acetylglucosaminyl-diphospho-decaprenol L-rhamnosyltransferase